MVKMVLCYDSGSVLFKERMQTFMQAFPEIVLEAHQEDAKDGRRKSFRAKSPFAARKLPFCGILVDGVIKKGFYSEVNQCTEDEIKRYVSDHFPEVTDLPKDAD